MKKLLPILALLFMAKAATAQVVPPCPVPPPPGAESCPQACVNCNFDGYTGTNNGTPSGGAPVCNGQIFLHNDQWFGFVAGSTDISIDLLTDNCQNGDGLQAAFFDACPPDADAIACNPGVGGGAGQPLNVQFSGFVPGQVYFFMLDGYSNDICDFTVDVVGGSVAAPQPDPPGFPQGPLQVCPGATVVYSIPAVDGANAYQWSAPPGSSINGGPATANVAAPEGNEVTITFGAAGGQVCVRPNNPCFNGQQKCINVVNAPIPITTLPKVTICYENLPYEPPFENANPVNSPGTYVIQTNPPLDSWLGCDSTVRQTVVAKGPIIHNDGVKYVCDGECYTFNGTSYCETGGPFAETMTNPGSGCDSTVTFNVVVIEANAVISPANPAISCGAPSVQLSASGSTTGGGVTYIWTNANWTILGTGSTYSAGAGGTYHLILRNVLGGTICYDTATVVVTTSAALPGATAIGGNIGCLNTIVTLQGSSNASGVTWSWSGPGINASNQSLQNPPVNVPGAYNLVVTNPANGCTSTANAQVGGDTNPPGATAIGDTINCVSAIANLNGGSPVNPVSFVWSGPNGFNSTIEDPTATMPGTYNLLVTNPANGCTSTASATISQLTTLPTVSAGADKTITCTTQQVTLNGSGSSSPGSVGYFWLGPGISPANQTISNPTVNQPGEYFLTVEDNISFCKKTDTVNVFSSIQSPVLSLANNPVITCDSASVTLSIGCQLCTGFNYLWSGPGITPANQNQVSPKVSVPGVYNLVVTNPANGCTGTEPLTVTTNLTPPTAMAGPDKVITCATTGGVLLDATGTSIGSGITFTWSGPGIGANNQNSATPVVTQPGLYTLLVHNANNGCTASDDVNVTTDADVPVADAGADPVIKCGITSVSLDGSGSSTGAGIVASWAGPNGYTANGYSPTGITQPGQYTLTIFNSNNDCEITDVAVVILDQDPPAANAGLDAILNCKNNGSVTLSSAGSSSGANVAYQWSGPSSGGAANLTTSLPGTYTLVVTLLSNNCTDSDDVVVTDFTQKPVADAGPDLVIDCNATTVQLQSAASANGANITYSWIGAGINATNKNLKSPTVDKPGIYEITVKDTTTGCQSIDMVEVTLDAGKPIASAGPDRTLTCFAPTAVLDGSASSAGANLTATWSGPDINAGNANQTSPSVTTPGSYIVLIENSANGCKTADTVQVFLKKTLPTASAGLDKTLNCQATSVTLDGSLSSAIDTVNYLWSGPGIGGANAAVNSPSVNLPGNYSIVVTHKTSGCTATDNVVVAIDTIHPTASAGPDGVLTCTVTTTVLDGSASSAGANFAYLWTGPGISPVNQNQQSPTVGNDGTYTLVVTNSVNKCTATDAVDVTLDGDFPLTNAGADITLSCKNDTLALNGSGSLSGPGINYQWAGPGIVVGNATLVNPLVFQPGTYTLTVFNTNNGCSKTDQVLANGDFTPPTANAGADKTITCTTVGGVTLSSAGSMAGATLTWSGPGITPANQNQPNPTVTVAGTYTLTVVGPVNGCSNTDQAIVFLDQNLPTASAGPDQTLTCKVTSVVLDGSGSTTAAGVVYKWSGPGITPANQAQKSPTVSQAGTYTIVVTNNVTGCTAEDFVEVLSDVAPPVFTTTTVTLTCTTPSAKISAVCADPLATYKWTGPAIQAGDDTKSNPTVSAAGAYKVTVTGGNGCTGTATVTVLDDGSTPTGTTVGDTLNCYNSGQGVVKVNSATPGVKYSWTGPGGATGTAATLNVSAPGLYSVLLTAPNGCTKSLTANVLDDRMMPNAVANVAEKLDCNTTSVSLNGSGSSVGNEFTYLWTTAGGNITAGTMALSAVADQVGSYQLLVTDLSNGCTRTASTLVENDPEVPTAFFIQKENIACYGEVNGLIQIDSIKGGTEPFTILFNGNPAGGQSFTGLSAGVYTINLQDANGCQLDTTITVTEPSEITLELGPDVELFLGDSTRLKAITNLKPADIATTLWTPPLACGDCLTEWVAPIRSVRYELVLTDSMGCSKKDAMNITVKPVRDIYVPTAFAPESNNNSLLTIHGGRAVLEIEEFRIFDRWGSLVFQQLNFQPNDQTRAWDGRWNGKDSEVGVYVWYAKVAFVDGEVKVYKGDVTLTR